MIKSRGSAALLLSALLLAACKSAGGEDCSKDSDCQGARICVSGACVGVDKPGDESRRALAAAAEQKRLAAEEKKQLEAQMEAQTKKVDQLLAELRNPTATPTPQPPAAKGSERAPSIEGKCILPREVSLTPNVCLSSSNVKWKDGGFLHHYRELSELTVQNTSSFAIGYIHGEITWINGDGSMGGSVPFALVGTVPPKASTSFSKAGGTISTTKIESNAPSHKISFSAATVDEGT